MEKYENMTLEELKDKMNEIFAEIQNEKIFMFGSETKEESIMHYENVQKLRKELRIVLKRIKELEG